MPRVEHESAARIAVAFAIAILLVAVAYAGGGAATSGAAAGKDGEKAPNFVVVLTDDQDLESMRVMPKVRKLITREGVSFTNYYATNPVCCPSRSTGLTGRYSHNTGVFRNAPPNGGFAVFDDDETLPVWLQRAGYATAHIGKYVNGYGSEDPTEIPPGWGEWYGSVDPGTYRMYGYTLNENGNLVTYGDYDTPDPANYQTDVYSDKAVDYIRRHAPGSQPFYLSIATLAPHVEVFRRDDGDDDAETPQYPNPRPAPRDVGALNRYNLPKPPSFNEADISDKPLGVRDRPLMSGATSGQSRNRYRSRLASLLAVDDMVKRIVATLRKSGELDDTVIVFMSDNGFLLGEHRIPTGKQYPYEESINVPFEITGPGIPRNEVRKQPAGNIDLAPTILDLAGAEPGGEIDGRSMMPLIKDEDYYPGRAMVLENWCQIEEKSCYDPYNPTVPRYRGVRTDRYAYMRYPNGEQELYDLEKDPYELQSLHNRASYQPERAALSKLLDRLQLCEAGGCRAAPKLKLKLAYRLGRRGGGKRCVRSPVKVAIRGADAGDGVSARFLLPEGDATDKRRPLRLRVKPRELKRGRPTPIAAQVSVLDGRIETVSGRVPPAC